MSGSRITRLLAALLPPVLLILLLALGAEAWIRYRAFGIDALVEPARFMAPRYKFGCVESGPDGELMTPDCRMRYTGVDLITNRQGLNDREVDEKIPHYRVLALGDSYTMAAGVPQREAWHAVLEERLGRDMQSPGFLEFYNYGRMGRNTADQVTDLEHALGIWPLDGALVAAVPSDFLENLVRSESCRPGDEQHHLTEQEADYYRRVRKGENPFTALFNKAEHETGMWIFPLISDHVRNLLRGLRSGPADADFEEIISTKAGEIFRSCAIRMREIADAAGIDLAWAILAYEPHPDSTVMFGVLRELGEPVISMQDVHEQFGSRQDMYISSADNHPNSAVQQIYAARIHDFLEELGWLQQAREALARKSHRDPDEK